MSVQAAVAFLNNGTTSSMPIAAGELPHINPVRTGVANLRSKFSQQQQHSAAKIPPRPNRPPSLTSSRSSSISSARTPPAHHASFCKEPPLPMSPPKRRSSSTASRIGDELVDMFQQLLDTEAASQRRIEQLEKDVERYALDSTKVRDYEIRVQYLAHKLEQVTEERDSFEQELAACQRPDVSTPATQHPSPPQHAHADSSCPSRHEDETHAEGSLEIDEKFLDGILGAYESQSLVAENKETCVDKQHKQEVEFLTEQLSEYDKGVKVIVEKYMSDLAQQQRQNTMLQHMVEKQDELIAKLEGSKSAVAPTPSPANEDALLQEQVELQRIELDNKRELLTQLMNEREELLKRVELHDTLSVASGSRRPSMRSSIDMLAELARSDYLPLRSHVSAALTYSSSETHSLRSSLNGRGTPPPSAPPRDPLPPLPSPIVPSSKISERSSSLSSSRTTSSTTSWSSSDCDRHASYIRRTNDMKSIIETPNPDDDSHTTTPFRASLKKQGSFWKGWKKKLDTL